MSWRRDRGGISAGGAAVGAVEGLDSEGRGVVVTLEMEERQWLMRARREVTEVCRRSTSAVRDERGIPPVDQG